MVIYIKILPEILPQAEITNTKENDMSDFIELTLDESEEQNVKQKDEITYEPVEKGIRRKLKNGKTFSYEVTIDFGRVEVYDEKKKKFVKKQDKRNKTFKTLAEARKYKHQMELKKAEAKDKKLEFKSTGVRLVDVADEFLAMKRKQAEKGKIKESYVEQLRIQTDHFKRFFNGERTTFVKHIQTAQIEEYFEFEEKKGISRKSIQKYKTHLKQIWTYMLKDKVKYGVSENVVIEAEISAPKTEYKASALDYKQLNLLIEEACAIEDPTFLYLVVMAMTQGLRRGELCGLMWKDINWETKRVTIRHNRVQLVTKDTVKLPKREKVREIELHKAGYDTLKLYKEWQESILGEPVKPDAFVMQWEINLLQNYVCHTGKVSRKWKEIYANINKCRKKGKKEELPYGRIHDGRHTYITLLLHGIKKDDESIIAPASFFQVYESAGHSLPRAMQNVSNTVYNEQTGDRWDITRFWNEAIEIDVANAWRVACEIRQIEEDMLTEVERATRQAQKQQRLEKAKKERLKGNPPQDILVDWEE